MGSVEVPVLTPRYVGFAPKVDGKVSEQFWPLAEKVNNFQLIGYNGPASQQTEVRVCYDRDGLYFLIECFEDRMQDILINQTEEHQPVWEDDSIEIFIAPYAVPGKPRCHHFVVSAGGIKKYLRPSWVRDNERWRAAVVRHDDRWTAEISIPLQMLHPVGRNEECWRIQIARNEYPHIERSTWAPVERKYDTYSLFGKMMPPDAPYSFAIYRGKLMPLESEVSAPRGVEAVQGLVKEEIVVDYVIPEPQEMRRRVSKGQFDLTPNTRIIVNDAADQTDMAAVNEINEAVRAIRGTALRIVSSSEVANIPSSWSDVIVVGESTRNAVLRAICERDLVRMPRSRFGTGSHVIDVIPGRTVVAGTSPADTYYAVQTLKQLIKSDSDGALYIPATTVRDYARFPFRGVHLPASKDALPYIGKMIEKVFSELKINNIVLEANTVAWESHPDVVDPDNHVTKEDIRRLIEIARDHHITVTPLIHSPGHFEWAFRDKNNLEFVEDPEKPFCYCMNNPKSYEFLFSIMDEVIELFDHPEYVHTGREEYDMIGRMPFHEECKAIGKQRLYFEDSLKIHEYLRSRGCKMMMWAHVFRSPEYHWMIDQLPNDIMITEWHYSPSDTYTMVDYYQGRGYNVLASPWYDPRNILTFSRYAGKRGIQGMLQSTFPGSPIQEDLLRRFPEQVYAYILAASWAWNPVRPDVDNLPYRPEAVFNNLWHTREEHKSREFFTLNLEPYCNISRVDSGRMMGWVGIGRGNDLRAIPEGMLKIDGVPYKILPAKLNQPAAVFLGGDGIAENFPKRVENIEVGASANALHFFHACAFYADYGVNVADYVVHYEDGATETIPLVYARNIHAWDDQSSHVPYCYAWTGKSQEGHAIGVGSMTWENPKPDTRITSIDFTAGESQSSPFVLAITLEKWTD